MTDTPIPSKLCAYAVVGETELHRYEERCLTERTPACRRVYKAEEVDAEIERLTRERDSAREALRISEAYVRELSAKRAPETTQNVPVLAGNAFVAKFKREPSSASDSAWLNGYAEALSGHETATRTWPPPPRKLTLYGQPDNDVGIDQPECYTAINIGGHTAAILVVTKMADGSPVPPYAQEVIDWMLGKHVPEA